MEINYGPVTFLPGPRSGKYPHCHSLVIRDGGPAIVIDPAGDRERLKAERDRGVDVVLATHYHEDHIMHLDLFPDAEVWCHRLDAPALADLDVFLDCYGLPEGPNRDFWREEMKEKFNYRPRRAAKHLEDGEEIDVGGGSVMRVLHTPGHTPGHLALHFPDQGVLLLGDYDLTPFGPWYGDVGASIDGTLDSVNRLRRIPAEVHLALHEQGVFTPAGPQLWDDYLGVVDYRDRRLIERLEKGPASIRDIVEERIVYKKKREPEEFFDFGERIIMQKHIDRLMEKGRIEKEGDKYILA